VNDYHIFHSVNRWLSPTSGWIKDQIDLFAEPKQTILADSLVNNNEYGYEVVSRPLEKLPKWFRQDFRTQAMKRSPASKQILFSHFGNRAWLDRNLRADRRIARFYGYDLHRLPFEDIQWQERYLELFELSDLVLTEGPFMQKELVAMGCPETKTKVLPLGVHVPDVKPERRLRSTPNVLIAGAFKEKKGILDALIACQKILDSGQELSIQLVGDVINDTERDRKYAEQLRSLVENSSLGKRINWHGFVSRSRLMEIATTCHFAMLPSKWAHDRDCEGGFPVTFLDIMSMGVPILSTQHCDIPFAVSSENGALVEEGDVNALVEIGHSLLNSDLTSKSIKAFETVQSRFNWSLLKSEYHQTIL